MAHSPFRGTIPDDRLYDTRGDLWVRREGDLVVIGATSFGLFLAGELVAFTGKPRGAEVGLGRGLATVESSKTVQAVHSPLALVIEGINEDAEERVRLVNADPYGAGWMVRARPLTWDADSAALVDAERYREHVRAIEPDAEFLP